jgi:hypothetical protein
MRFYRIDNQELWGDYGSILLAGIGSSYSKSEPFRLSRTGPFVPNATVVCGRLVITNSFKKELEKSSFGELKYRPIKLEKVVRIDWHLWDRGSSIPRKNLPSGEEPEDYLGNSAHDPITAKLLEPLWECIFPIGGEVESVPDTAQPWIFSLIMKQSSWKGFDLFSSEKTCFLFATKNAKAWLEAHNAEWLYFSEIAVE